MLKMNEMKPLTHNYRNNDYFKIWNRPESSKHHGKMRKYKLKNYITIIKFQTT